jgi:hypothetical protein
MSPVIEMACSISEIGESHKRLCGQDIGDLVEVWVKLDGIPPNADLPDEEVGGMPVFSGYIKSMDFDRLVLTNRSPFFPLPRSNNTDVRIIECITEIPYRTVYRVYR